MILFGFSCVVFFNHLKQGGFLFHTVDDERSAEDLVTAVLGVDLCKTENFGIGQFASEVVFLLFSSSPFLLLKEQGLLFRCSPQGLRCR